MGYYTTYTLELDGSATDKEKLYQALIRKMPTEEDRISYLFENGEVTAKLYNLPEEISLLAYRFPKLLIILSGNGENTLDVWEMRWKGKTFEKTQAILPPITNKRLLKNSNN